MKINSPLEYTPFRSKLLTESNEAYITLRRKHLLLERLLKVPLFESRLKEGIGNTYIVSKYGFKQAIAECVSKLKQTIIDNCHNLKAFKLLDYCSIEEKIDFEQKQVTFTLTWSNYYIPEIITSFTVNIIL
jgi:hypothetical protein